MKHHFYHLTSGKTIARSTPRVRNPLDGPGGSLESVCRLAPFLLLIIAMAVPAPRAAGATPFEAYNSFGPGDSYLAAEWWWVAATNTGFQYQGHAESFVPSQTGQLQDFVVATMSFYGSNTCNFFIAQDDGAGLPGTVLERMANVSVPNGLLQLNSAEHPTLQAGAKYWIYAEAANSSTLCAWFCNDQNLAGDAAVEVSPGSWIDASDSDYDGVFEVDMLAGCPAITLSPASLPDSTVGGNYSRTITAAGGSGNYTYSVSSGALPAGLLLSTNGVISGAPTIQGPAAFTITATDTATGCAGTSNYTIVVGCPNMVVAPATLPNAQAAVNYSQTITASGVGGAFNFAVTSGALPDGVTLSPAGLLSGIPVFLGNFNFTVTASNLNSGCIANSNYLLTVTCPNITVGPPTLPNGGLTSNYNQTITASGASGSFTYGVSSGALPPGLSLSTSGVLSGTPTFASTYTFSVSATNSDGGCVGSQSYALAVASPLPGLAAAWYGLIRNSNANAPLSRHTDGYFQITKLFNKESFSARIGLDGDVLNVTGAFDTNGNGSSGPVIVARIYPKPTLFLWLQVDLADDTISGVLSNAVEGWASTLTGDRYVFSAANPATQLQGSYTMIIPGNPGSPILPGGDGGARFTVYPNGMVEVQLSYLGDGTTFLPWTAPVSKNGDYPLFDQIYGLKGIIMGWLNFTPMLNPPAPTFTGTLRWEKPALSPGSTLYEGGFSNTVTIIGSGWNPALTYPNYDEGVLQPAPGTVVALAGGLLAPITNHFSLLDGTVTMTTSLDGTKLGYYYSYGGFLTLQFINPLHPSPFTVGHGYYLQTQHTGSGWFKGTTQSGQFLLLP